jgi:CelD/BcsL family acetyltransferase involved in cellulose biosynthesis
MASPHLEIREDVDAGEWAELVDSDPDATVFHRPWFAEAVTRFHPDWKATWLQARREGQLVAGLPFHRRSRLGWQDWVSGWGGSYGGPVGVDPAAIETVVRGFLRTHRLWRRHSEIVWASSQPPRESGPRWSPLETFVVRADGIEDFEELLLRRLPKNRRNECRRSVKRGLRVEVDPDAACLPAVWDIYREQCERWGSPPVHAGVWEAVLSNAPQGHLFVVLDEGDEVVGGHLCVELPGELFAWLGTTRRLEQTFPSSLIIREELRWVHDHGLGRLNLGSSMGLEGVRNYKALLGATNERRWIHRSTAWWWPRGRR